MAVTKHEYENGVSYSLGDETVLEAQYESEDGKLVIKIKGAVKTLVAPCFDEIIKQAMERGEQFSIDFSHVTYIASAGLRVLLNMQQDIDDRGEPIVTIINIADAVKEVFEQTGFMNILNVAD